MNFGKKVTEKEQDKCKRKEIVIGETTEVHFRFMGAIANGDAVIPCTGNKAIKFTRGPDFKTNGRTAYMVTVQILDAGVGSEVRAQSWQRTKTKIIKEKKEKKPEVKQKELKVIGEEVI